MQVSTSCDVCSIDVRELPAAKDRGKIIDGATKVGPWAWMCKPCWRHVGVGLGVGMGQEFDVTSGEKVAG